MRVADVVQDVQHLFEPLIHHGCVPAEVGDLVAELLACGSAVIALVAEGLADQEAEAGDDQRPDHGGHDGGCIHADFSMSAAACWRSTRWMVARETR